MKISVKVGAIPIHVYVQEHYLYVPPKRKYFYGNGTHKIMNLPLKENLQSINATTSVHGHKY